MATLSDIRRRGTELDVLAFIREVKRQARRKLPKGAKKAHVSAAVTRLLCEGEVQPPPGIWLPPVLAVVAVRRNFGVVYHWSCPVCRQPRRFLYYWPDETVARCRHCHRMSYASPSVGRGGPDSSGPSTDPMNWMSSPPSCMPQPIVSDDRPPARSSAW
jgi:hypothetical protein